MFDDMSVSATMLDVDWDEQFENGDSEVFTPRKSNGTVATAGVDLVRFIDLNVPGRYTFSAGFYFGSAFNGSVGVMLQDQNPVLTTPYEMTHGRNSDGTTALNLTGYRMFSYSRVYPLYDPFGSGNQFPVQCYFQIGQNSGSSKTCNEAFLDIHFEPVIFPT
jgi:hypothetical protein